MATVTDSVSGPSNLSPGTPHVKRRELGMLVESQRADLDQMQKEIEELKETVRPCASLLSSSDLSDRCRSSCPRDPEGRISCAPWAAEYLCAVHNPRRNIQGEPTSLRIHSGQDCLHSLREHAPAVRDGMYPSHRRSVF